ncbi:hypothetical protein M7I_0838 [Glarea lozoyensis 74030]|uniref:Uncharacterized protein n=1 Tax=Glarea lozoyensis (strain ATCC 74030 / MF5533) TaxID=1104152 RepID=H0EEG3_GLAL7|nr:hypothetical protein M7I_0838 [Glarea lozoyensis 74030]
MKSSLPAILAFSVSVHAANSCGTGYTICAPAGATSTTTPKIGSTEFQSLLSDIVGSSLPSFKRDTADGTASLCCLTSLSCLTLSNLALPFCYDKFTTNFLLPDGSFGTVANGASAAAVYGDRCWGSGACEFAGRVGDSHVYDDVAGKRGGGYDGVAGYGAWEYVFERGYGFDNGFAADWDDGECGYECCYYGGGIDCATKYGGWDYEGGFYCSGDDEDGCYYAGGSSVFGC